MCRYVKAEVMRSAAVKVAAARAYRPLLLLFAGALALASTSAFAQSVNVGKLVVLERGIFEAEREEETGRKSTLGPLRQCSAPDW